MYFTQKPEYRINKSSQDKGNYYGWELGKQRVIPLNLAPNQG